MGQQQARGKAVEALHHALEQAEPPLSEEQKESIGEIFRRMFSPEG